MGKLVTLTHDIILGNKEGKKKVKLRISTHTCRMSICIPNAWCSTIFIGSSLHLYNLVYFN